MVHQPQNRDGISWRERAYEIIFGTETKEGKAFDVFLLWLILSSIFVVILESMSELRAVYGPIFKIFEWIFTLLFTAEYLLRLLSIKKPVLYARSFYGIVDLLAILPAYLSLFVSGAHSLLVIRALRLLRVFRIFKLGRYIKAGHLLLIALKASRAKILVFLGAVLTLVLLLGTAMYLLEGEEHGFTSIPKSMYWAIVTLTTVGYGDIAPRTILGQMLASILMVLGYSIIAVPTGFVSLEMAEMSRAETEHRVCGHCSLKGHQPDAVFCRRCGEKLGGGTSSPRADEDLSDNTRNEAEPEP